MATYKKIIEAVKEIAETFVDYLPLTLRQIYYQLVGAGVIENNPNTYKGLSRTLTKARVTGTIEWNLMEDRTRYKHELQTDQSMSDFIDWQKRAFLEQHRRDLSQTQPNYIETWIEKDALSSLFIRVCDRYYIPLVVCKGFMSTSFLHEYSIRAEAAQRAGKDLTILYFGDFDPSGYAMLESYKKTLPERYGLDNIRFVRGALNLEDIVRYNLLHNPDALKESDSRAKGFIERFGRYAVELDAVPPDKLTARITETILECIDEELFEEQEATYRSELSELKTLKETVLNTIGF